MKKTLLFFAFALTVVAAQAQMPRLGIRAGVNYSGFTNKDEAGLSDRLWRFHAGITSQFFLTEDEFFAIKPEVLYSQKGAESEDDNASIKINYIDVPVLAHINAGPIYFEGGPQVGFRIGGETEQSGITNDDLDDVKRTSLGYVAGLGLSATTFGLNVGVRYQGGISQLLDNDNAPEFRNSVFMLTLAYMLPAR